jgi:uncharacterized protein YcfL
MKKIIALGIFAFLLVGCRPVVTTPVKTENLRILSLVTAADHILSELGAADKIVAIDRHGRVLDCMKNTPVTVAGGMVSREMLKKYRINYAIIWYYQKHLDLDMKGYFRSTFRLLPGVLGAMLFGLLEENVFPNTGIVPLIIKIFVCIDCFVYFLNVISCFLEGDISKISVSVRILGILEPFCHVALAAVVCRERGVPIAVEFFVQIAQIIRAVFYADLGLEQVIFVQSLVKMLLRA